MHRDQQKPNEVLTSQTHVAMHMLTHLRGYFPSIYFYFQLLDFSSMTRQKYDLQVVSKCNVLMKSKTEGTTCYRSIYPYCHSVNTKPCPTHIYVTSGLYTTNIVHELYPSGLAHISS